MMRSSGLKVCGTAALLLLLLLFSSTPQYGMAAATSAGGGSSTTTSGSSGGVVRWWYLSAFPHRPLATRRGRPPRGDGERTRGVDADEARK